MTAHPAILAIETSTEHCSVALALSGGILLRQLNAGPRSSSEVLPMARSLLDEAEMTLGDCAAIAFGEGPGAFTGLRIACGMAQGLAYGAGLSVIAVDSLQACALACVEETALRERPASILVAVDARMDEAYWANYLPGKSGQSEGEWLRQGPACVGPPESVALAPEQARDGYAVAGNAAAVYGGRLAAASRAAGATAVYPTAMPRADRVAAIALRHYAQGRLLKPEEAAPVYVRDKVAYTSAERALRAAGKTAERA
ncbi:MAG: tRNA (adenosine(37)-N6)-threonylcarbamoyltransferase complex dimerization subunit type 1 TsaB [Candidatus Protistobacter heckmanni]|nr:tRNA (adenosine(37)-N6)-threonylcarbamoyltransferase complex dimerization subunit type 1 TsaB [Candidatus Protistobacter heckmanni]